MTTLLTGCYTPPMGSGRGVGRLELSDGQLISHGLVGLTESPSFLIRRGDVVYAVNEADQGRVTSLRWDGARLRQLSVQNTGGAHPCHLAIDDSGSVLAVANYTGGSVSLHRLAPDGVIMPRFTLLELSGSGPVGDRQDAAHAHQVVFAGSRLHVVDLGSDRVWRYRLEPDGAAVELAPWALPPGFGPRQLVLDAEWAYVLGELSNQLAAFSVTEPGTKPVTVVAAAGRELPAGNLAAALVRPEPGRLLVSHRGADRITSLRCAGAEVTVTAEYPSVAAWPRELSVVEGMVLVCGQRSDEVVALAPDGDVVARVATPNPTCVLALD